MNDQDFDEILLESIMERKECQHHDEWRKKNQAKLVKIKPKQPITEKQSAKERHSKHKEWRKKNPQKVRDQVARHQTKTGQNKNREDTRLRKNRGEISKAPKCSSCGSTINVQHDHQKGYAKDSPTKPLCHKCHTNRPQQNKDGEKSVKGGTVRVKKESKRRDPLIKMICDNMSRQALG